MDDDVTRGEKMTPKALTILSLKGKTRTCAKPVKILMSDDGKIDFSQKIASSFHEDK